MPKAVYCPFFKFYTGKLISCENGKLCFESSKCVNQYLADFCGDFKNHKKCEIARKNYELWGIKK